MKVFILCHVDNGYVAAFDSREKAEAFVKMQNADRPVGEPMLFVCEIIEDELNPTEPRYKYDP